ncbi:acyltransferase family protein [Nocardioides litoris]|uniref:acyltransferase family protein n=1 Tax=Nocardioides litoris TaxID=1926648 RepID=UPI00112093F4|nr:acyltransferase family protein [Nocardioides litoris]
MTQGRSATADPAVAADPADPADPRADPVVRRRDRYRPDVQGLRAVAVLAVVAAHYRLPGLEGGYLGVDVFLVVSGFLITQLLLSEVRETGGVSVGGFWARRARRILPAATVVVVVTVALSSILLGAAEAVEVVRDAGWAAVFAANVRFAQVGTDYFAQDQLTSPLQHYWSLAVEEQFYVVWPLLVLGCVALLARRRRGSPTRALLVVLLVLVAASFAYAVHLTRADPVAAYFSTPARAWELGAGGVAAIVGRRLSAPLSVRARGLLALTGLVGMGMAFTTYDASAQARAELALLPVVATAMVLVAGVRGPGAVADPAWPQRLLGVRPLRAVGDWSYSLYLWHWPLLVVLEGRDGPVGWLARLDLALLALGLAALTHRFVETPLRDPLRIPRFRALALYPASVSVLALTCALGWSYAHHRATSYGEGPALTLQGSGVSEDPQVEVSPDPVVALVQASVYAGERGRPVPRTLRPGRLDLATSIAGVGECSYSPADVRRLCPRGDVTADRTLVVIGDSHAQMWISAFDQIAQRAGLRAYYLVKPQCTAASVTVTRPDVGGPWADCTAFRDWAFAQVERLRPDVTVLASTGPDGDLVDDAGTAVAPGTPARTALLQQAWATSLARLAPWTDELRLLRDVPTADRAPGACLDDGAADLGDCLFAPDPAAEADADASVRAARSLGVPTVDPRPWLCWRDRCAAVVGDVIPYIDRSHLTSVYAASLAGSLGRRLGLWPT